MDIFIKKVIVPVRHNLDKTEGNLMANVNVDVDLDIDIDVDQSIGYPRHWQLLHNTGKKISKYHSLHYLPIWTLVSGLAVLVTSSFLFHQVVTSDDLAENNNYSETSVVKSHLISYVSAIGILLGGFQVSVSLFNILVRKYGLKNWQLAQLMIATALAVNTTHLYAIGTTKSSKFYNDFAFFYSSVLVCLVSIIVTFASVLLC